MGVSTDAVLFYGYCWDEEGVDIFNGALADDTDWEDVVLNRRGVANPWAGAPADLDEYLPGERYEQKEARIKAWTDANRDLLDAWYVAQAAVREEFGVEVGTHCSGECPMPYLTPAGSARRSYRGHPQAIDPASLTADPEWAAKLDRFLAEFGIERPQPAPGWWLVSYWG
jgi:hypothetical protein